MNEQSFDLLRRTMNFELRVLPRKHVVPYFGYLRNSGHGHGIDTWVQDANNEFAVPVFLRDGTSNYHPGVRLEYNRFHVSLEEGGTTFKDDDQSTASGFNQGDRTTPFLGQPILHFNELATGNFALLSSLFFYSGQITMGTGAANQPHTTANAGFDLHPGRRLRVLESWLTDRYHDAASPFITGQLLAAPPARGQSVMTALNYSQVVNYNQEQTEIFFDLTSRMTLRGGYRHMWGDATVLAGQLSQTGPLVSGTLRRNVGLAGFNLRMSEKLALNLDYEGASSDHVYFRSSLNDYHLGRARVRYQASPSLSVQATVQVLNNQNPDPSIRYDFDSRDSSVSLLWTRAGGKRIAVTGEYDRATIGSNISYLLPPFFSPAISTYRDNAHSATSAIDLTPPGHGWLAPRITVGGSLFISSGSRPSRYYQPLGRLSFPLVKHVTANAEWVYYGFGEQFFLYENFRTHMFLVTLKLTR